jgi:hypothetical protein
MHSCKQCGEIKAPEMFRKYYTGKSLYNTCLDCEKINARYKYLTGKVRKNCTEAAWDNDEIIAKVLTSDEAAELKSIKELYTALKARGLKPPQFGAGNTRRKPIKVDELLTKYKGIVDKVTETAKELNMDLSSNIPVELIEWLTKDLYEFEPSYLQDVVAEKLQKQYRPQIGIDPETYNPVYDNTYRAVLNKILERFDNYEDEYKG